MFINRQDAGRQLAQQLKTLRGSDVVVLGLPRGGVPVGQQVADFFAAQLDVIVVRKLPVPGQPELAMGAVGEDDVRVLNADVLEHFSVSDEVLQSVTERESQNVARRVSSYREGWTRASLVGRTALIVDDGIATGATARAACQVARLHGATRVVLAVPVALGGRVASRASPGGYGPGLSLMFTELMAKRLELLRGIRPGLSRVGVLWRRGYQWRGAPQAAAQALGLTVRPFEALDAGELNDQFAAMNRDGMEALLVGPDEVFRVYHSQVLTLALAQRLPVMFDSREAAEDGGLISYGPDMTEVFRRAAVYVDKILKGAKPADLPVEQPTKFELIINRASRES